MACFDRSKKRAGILISVKGSSFMIAADLRLLMLVEVIDVFHRLVKGP